MISGYDAFYPLQLGDRADRPIGGAKRRVGKLGGSEAGEKFCLNRP